LISAVQQRLGVAFPHDALVQVGDAQLVVERVEREQELVERLGEW